MGDKSICIHSRLVVFVRHFVQKGDVKTLHHKYKSWKSTILNIYKYLSSPNLTVLYLTFFTTAA